jgi:hypothetical protein
MTLLALCERFVASHFPGAAIAVVGGSSARGTRTATSDVDLLVLGGDLFDDGSTSVAASYAFEGEVFEVFGYTPQAFAAWAQRGIEQCRPVIVQMLVEGVEVRGGQELRALRDEWAPVLTAGPMVDTHELDLRRYAITDLLDDLRDATDDLEQHVLAWGLFERTAELMLLDEHRWLGAGKYLPRRLRELSRERTDELTRPLLRGDLAAFADRVEVELDRAGGRVQAGFVR